MKTLIFNGSPRKDGDTVALITEMVKHLDGDVRIISAYHDDIRPCIDCRYCWEHKDCAIKDGMQEIYQLLDEVDNVIIASPIYYSELTGELLSLFSRLQLYYAIRYIQKDKDLILKRKKGVLILVGGGDGSMECAKKTAGVLFRQMNVDVLGDVVSHQTNNVPAREDINAIKRAQELAQMLNQLNE